jgi:hypothetical protein
VCKCAAADRSAPSVVMTSLSISPEHVHERTVLAGCADQSSLTIKSLKASSQ